MNKMRNTALTALAVAAVLFAAPQGAYAQGGRRTTATQQQQQQEQVTKSTTSGTTTTTPQTNSGTSTTTRRQTTTTSSQPAQNTTTTRQTTTTTRQSTPQVNSQPAQTVTRPANNSGTTTTTTNRRQDANNAQKANQPSVQPGNPQNNSGNRQNSQVSVRPGGSSTHQNGNGNAARPANDPKPQPQKGKNITPGYKPDAISHKPPKHPDYYRPGKSYHPKPYYSMGYHMFGVRMNTLPVGYVTRSYRNTTYYYHNGVFYKSNNLSGYIVCRPPVGFAFNAYNSAPVLPVVLIDPYRDSAVKISEAIALSRLYASMYPGYRMLDETYYFENVIRQSTSRYYGMDGIYYAIGGNTYTVVDPPIGALTDRLPYDYEEIWLGGDLFYLVDNIVYGVVAPEGVPYFEIFTIL